MKKSKALQQITKARVKLILKQPFFACLAMRMKFIEALEIETMATDGTVIIYNADFVESLPVEELAAVIAHEIAHIIYFHHLRLGARDLERFNEAADYAINPIIKASGLQLPAWALFDAKYIGKGAEEIYNLLPVKPKGNTKQGSNGQGQGQGQDKQSNDPGRCGGVKQSHAKTQSEKRREESNIKRMVSQAAQVASMQGDLPGHIKEMIEEILAPIVNWREVLNLFMDEKAKQDYTWTKPNPRYMPGLYLPSLESKTIGDFILIIDTSGSVDKELLQKFAAEMGDITSTFDKSFTCLHVDTKVQHVEEFEEDTKLEPVGRGGTSFAPGFEYIETEGLQPVGAIYFTDGDADRYPDFTPDYPVLWAVYGGMKHFNPPFGEVITVNEEN